MRTSPSINNLNDLIQKKRRTHMKQLRSWRVVTALIIAGAAFTNPRLVQAQRQEPSQKIDQSIDPKACVLHVDGHDIAVARFGEGAISQADTTSGEVLSDGKRIWLDNEESKTHWSVEKPSARKVTIVSSSDSVVAFVDQQTDFRDGEALHVLRRLDAKQGKWLSSLEYGEKIADQQKVKIVAASGNGDKFAVLFAITELDSQRADDRVVDRIVKVYSDTSDKVLWTYRIPVDPNLYVPGRGFLMASSYPNFADSDINVFSWSGQSLTICPDATGPLVSLDKWTGKANWAIDRPWEFQRGFIGPSVWSHFVERFGEVRKSSKSVDPKKREEFANEFTSQIIAGPVFAPNDSRGFHTRGSYILAVTVARKGRYEGYTGDCFLYEIDTDGKVVARTPMPQYLVGNLFHSQLNSVIFATQNGGLIKLRAGGDEGIHMGPGGPDSTGKIDWFFQAPRRKPYWISYESAQKLAAFDDKRAYSIHEGWYVEKAGTDAKSVTFPIQITDQETGHQTEASLTVPIKFSAGIPSTNYYQIDEATYGYGQGGIGITGLTRTKTGLRFQLATEKAVGYIEFSLPK